MLHHKKCQQDIARNLYVEMKKDTLFNSLNIISTVDIFERLQKVILFFCSHMCKVSHDSDSQEFKETIIKKF